MRTIHDRYLKDSINACAYQIMAEMSESEGDYSEASCLYQRAATAAANANENDKVSKLLDKSKHCSEMAFMIDYLTN